MNKILYIFFLFPLALLAQNLSFETWANGDPTDWHSSNVALTVTNVTQSSDAQSGNSAVMGEVTNFLGVPYPAFVKTGSIFSPYISTSQKYTSVKGYYKFSPQTSNELLGISVFVFDAGMNVIGSILQSIDQAASAYTEFQVDIVYSDEQATPAFIQILFSTGASSGTNSIGTSFLIDNITLETVTGLEKQLGFAPKDFSLKQNYPNPFNPSTTFIFSIPKASDVSLKVFNIKGQEVAKVVNDKLAAGEYSIDWNAENLASGIYIYRIKAGEFIQSRRMMLIK